MSNDDSLNIVLLIANRNAARAKFFGHCDPGNLTPPQKTAFQHRNMAFLLLLKAAQLELTAELELQALLEAEWDAQFEADAKAGKLDELAATALEEFRNGQCFKLGKAPL